MSRDLSELAVAAMMIDGVIFAEHCCVVALAICTDGTKVPVGLWLGDTENKTVVTHLLADLSDRGLDASGGILFVIDGSKALAAGVSPGTDGGLRTGAYQPQPAPAFAATGDAAAGAILAPQKFFAVRFGPSSNEKDPQTGTGVPAPSISVSGSTLTGDLRAFSVAWNGQQFNQGAPKPDGGRPGATSPVSGTYDPATKAYSITWSSQIVGGPFNNFTGIWTLRGSYQPA